MVKTETAETEIFRELLDSSMVPTPESLDAVIPSKADQCSIFHELQVSCSKFQAQATISEPC